MNDPIKIAFLFFTAGLVLLTVGFATRDSNTGVFSMWVGIVTVLATIGYYIIVMV